MRCPTCDGQVDDNPGALILILRILRERLAEGAEPITPDQIFRLLESRGTPKSRGAIQQALNTLRGQGDVEKRPIRGHSGPTEASRRRETRPSRRDRGEGVKRGEGWALLPGRYVESDDTFTSAPALNARAPSPDDEPSELSDRAKVDALREAAEEMSTLVRAVCYVLDKQRTSEAREEVILNIMRDVHGWDEVKSSLAIQSAITAGRLIQPERGFVGLPEERGIRNVMDDIEGENP